MRLTLGLVWLVVWYADWPVRSWLYLQLMSKCLLGRSCRNEANTSRVWASSQTKQSGWGSCPDTQCLLSYGPVLRKSSSTTSASIPRVVNATVSVSHNPSHLAISCCCFFPTLILKSPLSLDSWRVSSRALIRALTQAPALLEEGLRCCLGGERGITHFAWISWWCRLDWGRDWDVWVRVSESLASVQGTPWKEKRTKWAKRCKKDLRQEMSEILGSHLVVPELQRELLRQLCPALTLRSLYWKVHRGFAGFLCFLWKMSGASLSNRAEIQLFVCQMAKVEIALL